MHAATQTKRMQKFACVEKLLLQTKPRWDTENTITSSPRLTEHSATHHKGYLEHDSCKCQLILNGRYAERG